MLRSAFSEATAGQPSRGSPIVRQLEPRCRGWLRQLGGHPRGGVTRRDAGVTERGANLVSWTWKENGRWQRLIGRSVRLSKAFQAR